jgi:hypothetical protein
MYQIKCNAYFVFSCFNVVIEFDVEIIRFVYIVVFLIYHGKMWSNLKLIQWIKKLTKTFIKHYNVSFQVVKGLVNGFQCFWKWHILSNF